MLHSLDCRSACYWYKSSSGRTRGLKPVKPGESLQVDLLYGLVVRLLVYDTEGNTVGPGGVSSSFFPLFMHVFPDSEW